MGSHHVGKLACLFLGITGIVNASDKCTTFGDVQSINRECHIRPFHKGFNKPSSAIALLRLRCSLEDRYRTCMDGMIEDCSHKETIRAEIDNYFRLCDGQNGVSAWAEKHLAAFDTPDLSCMSVLWTDKSNASCKEEVISMARNYPYRDETLYDGLASIKRLKRAAFDCYKVILQEGMWPDEVCTDGSWRKKYMMVVVTITLGEKKFGLNLDEHDRQEIEDLQNEEMLQQILFPGFQ